MLNKKGRIPLKRDFNNIRLPGNNGSPLHKKQKIFHEKMKLDTPETNAINDTKSNDINIISDDSDDENSEIINQESINPRTSLLKYNHPNNNAYNVNTRQSINIKSNKNNTQNNNRVNRTAPDVGGSNSVKGVSKVKMDSKDFGRYTRCTSNKIREHRQTMKIQNKDDNGCGYSDCLWIMLIMFLFGVFMAMYMNDDYTQYIPGKEYAQQYICQSILKLSDNNIKMDKTNSCVCSETIINDDSINGINADIMKDANYDDVNQLKQKLEDIKREKNALQSIYDTKMKKYIKEIEKKDKIISIKDNKILTLNDELKQKMNDNTALKDEFQSLNIKINECKADLNKKCSWF